MKKFRRSEAGASALEFAIIAPLMIILLGGMYDLTSYLLAYNKMSRVAYSLTDMVGRGSLTQAQLSSFLSSAPYTAQPFDFKTQGVAIVTSVADVNDGAGARIKWQKTGGGSLAGRSSKIGSVAGGSPVLPSGFTVTAGETAVFAEVFYKFTPLFTGIFVPETYVYQQVVGRPRSGDLTKIYP